MARGVKALRITDIDYYAEFGESWLNKIPARFKLLAVAGVLAAVIFSNNAALLGWLYAVLLGVVLVSSVPKLKIIKMSFYPLVFLTLFLVSIKNLSLELALVFLFKALCASTSLILLIFTTSYIKIFAALRKILPELVVNMLFLTYRSIFILAKTLQNLLDMMKFRGTPSFKNLGNIIGFFVIKSIQTGENMYDAMRLRGYDDKKTAG